MACVALSFVNALQPRSVDVPSFITTSPSQTCCSTDPTGDSTSQRCAIAEKTATPAPVSCTSNQSVAVTGCVVLNGREYHCAGNVAPVAATRNAVAAPRTSGEVRCMDPRGQ